MVKKFNKNKTQKEINTFSKLLFARFRKKDFENPDSTVTATKKYNPPETNTSPFTENFTKRNGACLSDSKIGRCKILKLSLIDSHVPRKKFVMTNGHTGDLVEMLHHR